jgi:hypothetical protein
MGSKPVGLGGNQLQRPSVAILTLDHRDVRRVIRMRNRGRGRAWGFHPETADLP